MKKSEKKSKNSKKKKAQRSPSKEPSTTAPLGMKEKDAAETQASEDLRPDNESSSTVGLPKPERHGHHDLTVVAIGSSAGGLESLRAFFAALTKDTKVTFIIVQHLAPKYKSMLAELIGRTSQVKVVELETGTVPKPGTAYITPPDCDVVFKDGSFVLHPSRGRLGPKPSVDRLFTSLAEGLGERAVGVVFSGTGSDGAEGIRHIKNMGGVTIAQKPSTAKYAGMPMSAICTGMVDFTLSPSQLAEQLPSILATSFKESPLALEPEEQDPFRQILKLLHSRTGIDFSFYKQPSIRRRIQRRMVANNFGSLEEYCTYVSRHPKEARLLFNDTLISVTSFFRDPDDFEKFRTHLKDRLKNLSPDSPFRVWVAGCATGQEAYTVAMLCHQIKEELDLENSVQIFATDIDEKAMAKARRGAYSTEELKGIRQDLLDYYFEPQKDGYQVLKFLREMVIFARHDITKDPPFLRMDLVCCRNVFIYLKQPIQDRILKLFHYALRPGGLLFLGNSESIGSLKSLFETVEERERLYRRSKENIEGYIPFGPLSELSDSPRAQRTQTPLPRVAGKPPSEVFSDVLHGLAPNCIVVDRAFNVKHCYGFAKELLGFQQGELSYDLPKLIAPDLRDLVSSGLSRAKRTEKSVRLRSLRYQISETEGLLEAEIFPLKLSAGDFFIVKFTFSAKKDEVRSSSSDTGATETDLRIGDLERELNETREHLQTVIEEQETSNEELQALNEELQSANEELQSSNEELETSNEELQASNEELTTLNEELRVKSSEIVSLNRELRAIEESVDWPIIVIDSNLCLRRFNRAGEKAFGIGSSSMGRNIHVVPKLKEMSEVFGSLKRVMEKGDSVAIQQAIGSTEYSVTIQPMMMKSSEEAAGLVLTFANNTKTIHLLKETERERERFSAVLSNSPYLASLKQRDGQYTFVNPAFCKYFDLKPENVLGKRDDEIFPPTLGGAIADADYQAYKAGKPTQTLLNTGTETDPARFLVTRFVLPSARQGAGNLCTMAVHMEDHLRVEEELKLFRQTVHAAEEGVVIFSAVEGDTSLTFVNQAFLSSLNSREQALTGQSFETVMAMLTSPGRAKQLLKQLNESGSHREEMTFEQGDASLTLVASFKVVELSNSRFIVGLFFDATEQKRNETTILDQQDRLISAGKLAVLGEMSSAIAHELNTPLNSIQAHVDLLRQGSETEILSKETVEKTSSEIEDTVQRISEVIQGLRGLAREDKSNAREPVDLNGLVDETARLCAFHFQHHGVSLNFELAQEALTVSANRIQLSQVLVNLMNNSVDAVADAKERLVQVRTEKDGNFAKILVSDSGPGIPKDLQKRVMERFFTTKTHDKGTGLGLTISRTIIEKHGGSLSILGEDESTEFEIRLPLKH